MMPAGWSAILLLAVVGVASAAEDSPQLKAVLQEKETLSQLVKSLEAELSAKQKEVKSGVDPLPEDAPVHIMNNASNDIVLANCLESYEIKAGEEIQTTMLTGGFWVLPAGQDFNCSVGCSDCFYVSMDWGLKEGAAARIGFGLGCDHGCDVTAQGSRDGGWWRPQGGGIKLSVNGSGSVECTDESCDAGWRKALRLDPDSSVVSITIEGSKLADQQVGAADGNLRASRIGRIGRPVFRRPVYRRPIYRRPIYRRPIYRRPIYRPIYRPIITPAPTCYWCNQYGYGTCWWLCR